MMIYKLLAASLVFTLPLLAQGIHTAIPLKTKTFLVTDLTWPLYALSLVLVSKSFFGNSFLPHYLVLVAVLSIILTLWLAKASDHFSYRKWFKLFWRWNFFLALFAYLLTLLAIFLLV